MNHFDQRALAARLFPLCSAEINDSKNCYEHLIPLIVEKYGENEAIETAIDAGIVNSYTAVVAAKLFQAHKDKLRPLVTGSLDALEWAVKFPDDREHMRQFVTGLWHSLDWAIAFPEDREHMWESVTSALIALRWATDFPEDRTYFRDKGLIKYSL